jgi:ATP-binding cassette subfamily A (ABC1) protein 3
MKHRIRCVIKKCLLCSPQHNVLFPMLTVTEHLRFFGEIKGLSGASLASAIEKQISEVGLTEKRHAASHTLSGGMKRKLSLAIALVGDPRFVLVSKRLLPILIFVNWLSIA